MLKVAIIIVLQNPDAENLKHTDSEFLFVTSEYSRLPLTSLRPRSYF